MFSLIRWYVQLPTQQAHQYHELETRGLSLSPSPFPMSSLEEEETVVRDENCALPSRLHPQVAHKIQELVSQGVGQVYAVRKQLRYRRSSVFFYTGCLSDTLSIDFPGHMLVEGHSVFLHLTCEHCFQPMLGKLHMVFLNIILNAHLRH